jgi:hypothetical protein
VTLRLFPIAIRSRGERPAVTHLVGGSGDLPRSHRDVDGLDRRLDAGGFRYVSDRWSSNRITRATFPQRDTQPEASHLLAGDGILCRRAHLKSH